MSSTKITLLAICMVAFVAGCAQKSEETVFVQEPVATEPVFTGKYQ